MRAHLKRIAKIFSSFPKRLWHDLKYRANFIYFWVFLASLIAIIGLSTLPEPSVLVSADIQTETVKISVSNPSEAAFMLPQATDASAPNICQKNILITPQTGTDIYVSQVSQDGIYINLDGSITVEAADKQKSQSEFISLYLPYSGECALNRGLRLPVAGKASVGIVSSGGFIDGEPSLVLHDGELTVYGRAVPKVFGIPVEWFWFLPMEADRLYLADKFDIPAGSQVGSETARWWGFLDLKPDSQSGFNFQASTNAQSLNLQAPAPKAIRSNNRAGDSIEADEISLTFGARLSHDPNLRWVFAAISFIMFFVSVIFQSIRTRDELG